MPPCLANHPNTSRRELLVGRRELLQVSVEKGETPKFESKRRKA
jgi:hypothetical protein